MLRAVRTVGKPVARVHGLSHVTEREHGIALVVALGYVLLAVADGGFSAEVRAIAAIALWWAVVVALLLGLWPRAPIPRQALVAGLLLTGLAALTALSMAWASDDGRAFVEIVRVLTYLGLFVAVVLASSAGRARPWLVGLALGLMAVCVLALGSRLEPAIFPDDTIAEVLPSASGRLSAPFGYWNGVGACMATAIVLLAWLGSAGQARWSRALATGAIPAAGLALYMTSSRGAFVALLAGLAALLLAGSRRAQVLAGVALGSAGAAILVLGALASDDLLDGALRTSAADAQGHRLLALTLVVVVGVALARRGLDARLPSLRMPMLSRRTLVLGGGALVVTAILAVAIAGRPAERLSEFADPATNPTADADASRLTSVSGTGRYQYWSVAVEAFASRPALGIGAGGYQAWWNAHGSLQQPIRDAHSLPLEALAELGMPGLLLVIGFPVVAVASLVRSRERDPGDGARGAAAGLLAIGVVAACVDWAWELPAVFAPTVIAVALLVGPALAAPPRADHGRFGVGVATLLVAWVAILAAAASLATEYKLGQSRDAVERGDLAAAAADARQASSLQPWAAEPWFQRARIERLAGDSAAADRSIGEALRRAPDDYRIWIVASRIKEQRGDILAFLLAFGQSQQLTPGLGNALETAQ